MALSRTIMNRRFGWITPHILSKISIKLDTYAPYTSDGSGFVGEFKTDTKASYGDLISTYGYKDGSNTFEINNFSLQLNYFDIIRTDPNGMDKNFAVTRYLKMGDDRHSYWFDDSKYYLQVITSNIYGTNAYDLSTYFTGKKLFKILDIYLEKSYNSDPAGASRDFFVGSLKIYYLEKK